MTNSVEIKPNVEPYNETPNSKAFAIIKSDGSVFAWGDKNAGGDTSSVASQLNGDVPVIQIYTNDNAFAALRSDGSVVTWGDKNSGGDSGAVADKLHGNIDITSIYSNGNAFAALRSDGSVITWGDKNYGGDSSSVASQLNGSNSNPVVQIYSGNWGAFAALRKDGSVVTWGDKNSGGDSSAVADKLNGEMDVTLIYSDGNAFAALRSDGSVVSWGKADYDVVTGLSNAIDSSAITTQLSSGVTKIVPLDGKVSGAFAAIQADGSIFTWGAKDAGADISSSIVDEVKGTSATPAVPAVTQIYFASGVTNSVVAALRDDNSVISWGGAGFDMTTMQAITIDSKAVDSQLNGIVPMKQIYSPVKQIYSHDGMMGGVFAALREDGSVFTWGEAISGGDSSLVANKLDGKIKVTEIYSGSRAFAALREDGSVVTWGNKNYGGDSSSVANQLNGKIGVKKIYSGDGTSFAALRDDGSVVTWGDKNYGGDSSTVANDLNGTIRVSTIYSNGSAFAALRIDGSVITWGDKSFGGDSSLVADQLSSDVMSFADVTTDDVYTAAKDNPVNQLPTGNVTIKGSAKQDEKLSADTSAIKDANGLGDFSYQWLSNESEILGATSSSYLLLASDVGRKISVNVSYLDSDGFNEFVLSKATNAVISSVSTNATNDNDQITGTAKAEKIDGLAGNDLIKGLAGNDTLIGGAGLDTLLGGAGADQLTGGKDADIFKLSVLADSGTTSKTRDIIIDFKHDEKDRIDLSAIDANEKLVDGQGFTFIGNNAFSTTNATGQLRFDGTSHILYGSTNADSKPEFSIQINGVTSLIATDFIL